MTKEAPSSNAQQTACRAWLDGYHLGHGAWRFSGAWSLELGAFLWSARLLIIEDELPMRTALKDCLESEGYRVLTAADGESGLQRAFAEKPDLILLDIMLPRLDGLCPVRRIATPRQSGSHPDADGEGTHRGPVTGLNAAPMITWSNRSARMNYWHAWRPSCAARRRTRRSLRR